MINFEKKDRYLLISGEGELSHSPGRWKEVYSVIEETKSRLVLVDYRKVNFNIQNVDAFNAIRFYESKFPTLAGVSGAVVLNADNMEIGHFWRDMGKSRGFNFQIFRDIVEAENWLLQQ
jgi:hypothetical protein